MGPFCHANAPHPVRPFPRGCSPPPVRYPRRAQRPGVRSLCPEEFLGTLCHPIATEGSPPRRSIHDSDREKLGNFDTKGGGKDKGIVSTRELFLSEWRRCAERQRERERDPCVEVAVNVSPPFNKGSRLFYEERIRMFSVPRRGEEHLLLRPRRRNSKRATNSLPSRGEGKREPDPRRVADRSATC